MYDFLDPRLLPKVECCAASIENYEITNLVADNMMTRARGFLAYTSIKPPVDIDFELLAPVSINYVSISAQVGSQQVTGIELYGKNVKSPYVLLGRAVFDEPGVIFCNLRYYTKDKRPTNTDCNYHVSFLKRNQFRTIINSSTIKIRIFRTSKSVPCLGLVKVFGKISKSCSKTTADTIEKLMKNKILNVLESDEQTEEESCEDIFGIPDEFKDALTYEIMALPMTLPSGHTVDKTTLEKCLQNDVRCGRHGLDPFTGIPFSSDNNPILNVALKTRIDMFLTLNAHRTETHQLKRTVGGRMPTVKYRDHLQNIPNPTTNSPYNNNRTEKRKLDDESSSDEMDNILKTLKGASNYISFLNEEETIIINKCIKCEKGLTNLYKLPCKDIFCRECLLKICANKEICSLCHKPFMKKDVEKYNS